MTRDQLGLTYGSKAASNALGTFLGAILGTIIGFLILAVLLMWAWNTFMPDVFGWPQIDFIKGLALAVMLGSIGRVQVNNSTR